MSTDTEWVSIGYDAVTLPAHHVRLIEIVTGTADAGGVDALDALNGYLDGLDAHAILSAVERVEDLSQQRPTGPNGGKWAANAESRYQNAVAAMRDVLTVQS